MTVRSKLAWVWAAAIVLGMTARASEFVQAETAQTVAVQAPPVNESPLPDQPGFKLPALADLPPFENDLEVKVTKSGKVHTNGLVTTINYDQFKSRKVDDETKLKLPTDATGFKKELEVRLLRQEGPAPLAILLLGFHQKADDKLARAWQADLHDAGCHVLSFDSIIRKNMNERMGHGVAGNFMADAQAVTKIVHAALHCAGDDGQPPLKQSVTSTRILSASYGGALALHLIRLPQVKDWNLDRVAILSTPVSMHTAASHVSSWAREDLPKFGPSLLKLLNGYTPEKDNPGEEEQSLMRAGIGYVFFGDLEELVEYNAKAYMPDVLDKFRAEEEHPRNRANFKTDKAVLEANQAREEATLKAKYDGRDDLKDEYKKAKKALENKHKVQKNELERKLSDPKDWTFGDYVQHMLVPYWKLDHNVLDRHGDLGALLEGAPNYVQVVLAADDPLNDPKELLELRKKIEGDRLVVLPYGGHLGFVGTEWCEQYIETFFKK